MTTAPQLCDDEARGRPFRIRDEKPLDLAPHAKLFPLVSDERPEEGCGAWTVSLREFTP